MDIEKSIGILKVFRNYNKFYKEENKNLTITITLETKESIDKAIEILLTAYEKGKGENVKLRLQDIPLIEGELKAYKDRVNELKIELEKEKEKNKELSDKLTEKICKGVEEDVLEEYRQIIIDKDKLIEELKKYKKKDKK